MHEHINIIYIFNKGQHINIDTKDYVLGKLSTSEKQKLDEVIDIVIDILDDYFNLPFDTLMSKYNHK